MAMAEADWSELPKDVLNLISQRFDNDLDLIRFRSVCSPWRRSSISNQHHYILPFKLPSHFDSNTPSPSPCSLSYRILFMNDDFDTPSPISVSKHILFLIKPPSQQEQQEQEPPLRPWLIRVTKNSRDETQLFHPLRPCNSPSPYDFPYVLDFNKFSNVVHLGTDFFIKQKPNFLERAAARRKAKKVITEIKVAAVTCHGKKPLALCRLTCKDHLLLLRCSEERWTPMPYIPTYFENICVFKERFCVVNKVGRTFAIGPDYSVELVAEHVAYGGGDIKFLVESEGELLLVDIYDPHCFGFPGEDGLKLDVFRLDEKEKEWVKLTGLGDRVLFLGNGCSFLVSTSDLSVVKGNCVIFVDDSFLPFGCGMCVFHLDQGRLSPLSDYPDYFNLFWPPPEWIVKLCSRS